MKGIYILIPFLLLSCGNGPVTVDLHVVSQAEVYDIACANGEPEDNACIGYAVWDGNGNCDIYVISMEEVGGEDNWNWLLGHELRHCFEGNYHE